MTVTLRPPTLDDVSALTDLMNRATEELYGARDETETIVRQYLTTPRGDPEQDIGVAISDDGTPAGYADVNDWPHPKYWIDLRVPPSAADDVRSTLLAWAERRAGERTAERLYAQTSDRDAPLKALLEREGWRLIRHSYRMRIELDGEPKAPSWPDGVTVRATTEKDAVAAYEAHMETFEDVWEHPHLTYEEWWHWLVDDDHDWSLWFLAESGDDVAGVALCRRRPTEPEVGVVRVLGVRRPWRRQGLGRALLLHVFDEFRRRCCNAVTLGVDAESLTGAHRLYESAGMRVVRRSDVYEKVP